MVEKVDSEETLLGELSSVPFNDVLHLKDVVGNKEFSKIFGNYGNKKSKNFKRENKNRPREISSKKLLRNNLEAKITSPRDPRFESFCGSFNTKRFEDDYSFINKIRKKERSVLIKELKDPVTDENRKKKIQSLIQRINDSIKSNAEKKCKATQKMEEQRSHIEALKRGQTPNYTKKSEKKLLELVNKYEELKQKGKVNSHIRKRRKKLAERERSKPDML